MKRRFLSLALVLIMLLSLAACSKDKRGTPAKEEEKTNDKPSYVSEDTGKEEEEDKTSVVLGHTHEFADATCTEPKKCDCGETDGDPLGHDLADATCTEPATCTRCGATEGEALGHDFGEPTCAEPATCTRCDATEGEPAGHEFGEPTCTDPATCANCDATEGEALGHDFGEPTCAEPATCTRCDATEGEPAGHEFGEATCTEPATCANCDATDGKALGHDFKDGTCTRCSEPDPAYETVWLDTLSPINGGFTWNDGNAEDPFGTDYTGIKNFVTFHETGGNWWHDGSCTHSAEYKTDKQYNHLTFTVSPYSDFGQGDSSYLKVYADGVLRFISPKIYQKLEPTTYSVDISNAAYIKIVVHIDTAWGCTMLSNVALTKTPGFESPYTDEYTSLASLDTFNGSLPWDNEYPASPRGDDFTYVKNFAVMHETGGNWWHDGSCTHSAEYYVNKNYSSLSFNIVPASDFVDGDSAYVKVYLNDVLVYTSPQITQKTQMFSTGAIDISETDYLKIVVEVQNPHGCTIISDVMLKNK